MCTKLSKMTQLSFVNIVVFMGMLTCSLQSIVMNSILFNWEVLPIIITENNCNSFLIILDIAQKLVLSCLKAS